MLDQMNDMFAAAAHAQVAVEKAPADLAPDAMNELRGVATEKMQALSQHFQATFEAYKAGV